MLSALILAFLGVPDETIVADYTLSAPAMERLLDRLKAEYPDSVEEVDALRARPSSRSCPRPWRSSWPRSRSDYGSYDALAESLGVTDAVARPAPHGPGRGLSRSVTAGPATVGQ